MRETVDQYKSRLRRLHVKKLGSGLFSTVYAHPQHESVAVKAVFEDDPMYMRFARAAKKHQSNPWFPKIFDITRCKMEDSYYGGPINVNFVFLERLQRAKRNDIKRAVRHIIDTSDVDDYRIRTFTDFSTDTWEDISRSSVDEHVRALAKVLASAEAEDIHSANVMMRGDQLVFTDPVAS